MSQYIVPMDFSALIDFDGDGRAAKIMKALAARRITDDNAAIDAYIAHWFAMCPDVNPADVVLQIKRMPSGIQYKLVVDTENAK